MFIGCRGTVLAGPTMRWSCSRDASEATLDMPLVESALARLGLSMGCCGGTAKPLCSPVTRSDVESFTLFLFAQAMFWLISEEMSAADMYSVLPPLSVWQRHGMTVKSCRQPRNK